jgi:type I restriction enzyme S subunit
MADWKEYKFSDLVRINAESIGRNYPFEEIKYLDTGSITKGKIDSFQDYEIADAPSRAKRLVKDFDIVYSTVRPIQRHYGLIRNPIANLVVSTGFAVLSAIKEKANPVYLYYFLTSDEVVNYLDVVADGSTSAYPSLTPNVIADLEILLPPLPEQQAIAEVLSSLDDKIDLLHRQNKTLEALAETLFRQWLVEEAEESWETASLFDVVELVGGGTPKTEVADYWDGDIKWISAKDITPNHKKFIVDTEKKITEQGLKSSSARLLPKYATIISARGTVGNYCILSESMTFSQSNYGIKPKFKDYYFFTYLLIANAVEELQSAAYGSVFDTITTSTFKEHQIKIPPEKEIQNLDENVKPYFEKMLSNEIQIRSLIKLRDELLPKLMGGDEVRVKIAEAETAAVNQ